MYSRAFVLTPLTLQQDEESTQDKLERARKRRDEKTEKSLVSASASAVMISPRERKKTADTGSGRAAKNKISWL